MSQPSAVPPIGLFAAELLVESGPELAALGGDYRAMFERGMGLDPGTLRVLPFYREQCLPPADELSGVIVTGALAMVTEQRPWAEYGARWLARHVGQLPMLGVCFGHQLINHALGGTVEYMAEGPEYGTADITLTAAGGSDPLFGVLPECAPMQVGHAQGVTALPEGAEVLATGERGIQGARFGPQAWGVQFHPEFGPAESHLILDHVGDSLAAEGIDVAGVRAGIAPSPAATKLLRAFARLCSAR